MSINIYNGLIGKYAIEEENGVITHLYFEKEIPQNCKCQETPLLKEAHQQVEEYFAGKRTQFSLPLGPQGTPFMKTVWKFLQEIPYGQTATYGQIAQKSGNPKAARAVGLANNKNPLPIFIPCHRVVGANGKLTGFRGGLDMKELLLNLEKK